MKLFHNRIDIKEIIELVLNTEDIIFDESAVSAVKEKGAADYVTKVDTGVQDYMQKELADRYPEIGFIGEESGLFAADRAGCYWILDPIDGTTNLIHHYQMSAVSLGLYESGRMSFGIVYNPFSKEMFVAVAGQGAYLNGRPIHVSEIGEMKDSLVSYGSSPYLKDHAREMFAMYERIFLRCADFRRCGSAALDLCYIACGRQDAYLEENLKPWDYAAGALILQEAGGRIDCWKAEETIPYLANADILASNGNIHEDVRACIYG